MLIKINRQDCLKQYETSPWRSYDSKKDEEAFFYPKGYKNYILTLPSKSFKGHAKALGVQVTKLAEALHTDTLIFLGDTETPWLYQDNDYKPVKKAQEYLTANGIGKRFNGALQVNIAELLTFVKHLAWLARCNAALPCFHFIDERQTIVSHICRYGNLHLDTLNEQANRNLEQLVENSRFEYGNTYSCYNRFGKSGAIAGRRTVV